MTADCINIPNKLSIDSLNLMDTVIRPKSGSCSSNVSSIRSDDNKDSGVDCDDLCIDSFGPVDSSLVIKIVKIVENYFSDENLRLDSFLRKHIKKNKDGYVSLKLVSSFRKLKSLTKDWRVVAYSIKNASTNIKLNESTLKIKRLDPLPDFDDDSTKLIAYNFPSESNTRSQIKDLFSSCGSIVSLDLYNSTQSKPIPDIVRSNVPEAILQKQIAVIEFEESESVVKAMEQLGVGRNGNWRSTIQLIPLNADLKSKIGKKSKRRLKRQKPSGRETSDYSNSGSDNDLKMPGKSVIKCPNAEEKLDNSIRAKSNTYSACDLIRTYQKRIFIETNNLVQIIRSPLGPDGTKGFKNRIRTRSEPARLLTCLQAHLPKNSYSR